MCKLLVKIRKYWIGSGYQSIDGYACDHYELKDLIYKSFDNDDVDNDYNDGDDVDDEDNDGDDVDNDNSLTPPTSITSPLLFSPPSSNKPPISTEKNTIFFNKSFESKPTKLTPDTSQSQTPSFNIFPSVTTLSTQQASNAASNSQNIFTNSNSSISMSVAETRKPFTLSHNESPKSFNSSPVSSPHVSSPHVSSPIETPITLLTSPKSRNRRNSSFDETKPHVCNQCGARFTTKSNLGQHAKIHLAVKPFICEICNHGFTRAAHYESHVAKHKGLKTHR